jgi:hypothetical protein
MRKKIFTFQLLHESMDPIEQPHEPAKDKTILFLKKKKEEIEPHRMHDEVMVI